MVDDSPFMAAMRANASFHLAFNGVFSGAALAGLAVLAGGLLAVSGISLGPGGVAP